MLILFHISNPSGFSVKFFLYNYDTYYTYLFERVISFRWQFIEYKDINYMCMEI